MYTSLSAKFFRSFHDFSIEGLQQISLIAGRNNAGKTTLLEAIFLLGGGTNPVFPMTIAQMRGQKQGGSLPDPVWRSLYHNLDPTKIIELAGRWDGDSQARKLTIEALRVSSYAEQSPQASNNEGVAQATQDFSIGGLRLRYQSPKIKKPIVTEAMFDPKTGNVNAPSRERTDFVRSTYLSARAYSSLTRDAEQFSYLVKIKAEDEVVSALRLVEPRISRIEVVSEAGSPTVYVDVGLPSLAPLAVCGEGVVRLFSIVVELTASRGGVLLVDEIDNGLHFSIMEKFWTTLGALAQKHKVQIVATTHNEELIHSAIRVYKSDLSRLAVFRIDRHDDHHRAVTYADGALEAVETTGFEVRG